MIFTFQMFTETTFKLLCFIFIIFQKCFNEMLKTFSYSFFFSAFEKRKCERSDMMPLLLSQSLHTLQDQWFNTASQSH